MAPRRTVGNGRDMSGRVLMQFLDDDADALVAMPEQSVVDGLADVGLTPQRIRDGVIGTLTSGHRGRPLPTFFGSLRGLGIDLNKDLVGKDLSMLGLSGEDVSGADLSHCDLSGSDLSGADLSGAKLVEARLVDASLANARLDGADLSYANVESADLAFGSFSGVVFDGVDLTAARMTMFGAPQDQSLLVAGDGRRATLSLERNRRIEEIAQRIASFGVHVSPEEDPDDLISGLMTMRRDARQTGGWIAYLEASLRLAVLRWRHGSLRHTEGVITEVMDLAIEDGRDLSFAVGLFAACVDSVYSGRIAEKLQQVKIGPATRIQDLARQTLLLALRLIRAGDDVGAAELLADRQRALTDADYDLGKISRQLRELAVAA